MENKKKRTINTDKQRKLRKIKYRKKKKPIAAKSLTALNAAQNVLEKSEPKQKIAMPYGDNPKCDFSDEFIEIITRDIPAENALAIVNKKTSGIPAIGALIAQHRDEETKNSPGTNSLALGSENTTNTVGPLTNDSRQGPSLPFWQRILKFLGIRRSK